MTSKDSSPRPKSILVINPNSTKAMTDALVPLINNLNLDPAKTTITYFTPPTGPPSINNNTDAATSTTHCLTHLNPTHLTADAFLIACFSAHPLVPQLRHLLAQKGLSKPVTGILDASLATSLQLSSAPFGIVSTGAQWSAILDAAVAEFLGLPAGERGARYVGTETTGLNADELHSTAKGEVDRRMREATKRVVRRGARTVCLGCAGMAGLEAVVREACVEELGPEEGGRVRVVDGVVSGVLFLEGALRAGW